MHVPTSALYYSTVSRPNLERQGQRSPWGPTLTPALNTRALGVAHDVAQRLGDQQRVGRAIFAAPRQTAYPRTVRWQPQGLAQGDLLQVK